jgi:hypothetical protein
LSRIHRIGFIAIKVTELHSGMEQRILGDRQMLRRAAIRV